MSAEEDLQKIANGQWWNLPASDKTVAALRNLQTILGNVASDTGITGTAGMSASETLDQTKKDVSALIDYVEKTLPAAVKAANDARETAKAELRKLGAGQLDSGQLAAIRGAEAGATVFLGPFSIIAGETAIAVANNILGNQRNGQAEESLDKVNTQLHDAHEQISAPPEVRAAHKSEPPVPPDPEPNKWVDPTPNRRSGGGGPSWNGGGAYVPGPGLSDGPGYPRDPGGSGGPGYTILPNPGGSGGPVIVPTPDGPISGGTTLPGGGIHVPGGAGSGGGSGLLGGSGGIGSGLIAGAGGGAALGGLGKLAAGGGAGGLGRLGGGGLGAGAGSAGAGAAGRSGGLLGGAGGSGGAGGAAGEGAAGGRGTAGMAGGGMGAQGGAGGKNDKRGRGLGGPLAPKLEDDEEIGPWSENAGAGGRD